MQQKNQNCHVVDCPVQSFADHVMFESNLKPISKCPTLYHTNPPSFHSSVTRPTANLRRPPHRVRPASLSRAFNRRLFCGNGTSRDNDRGYNVAAASFVVTAAASLSYFHCAVCPALVRSRLAVRSILFRLYRW